MTEFTTKNLEHPFSVVSHHCRFGYRRFRDLELRYIFILFRYVDDIATAISNHLIEEFLEVFNSFHSRLQFTLEVGCDRLNFLTIIKMNGTLEFNIYHKLTFSERYLSFCLVLFHKREVFL